MKRQQAFGLLDVMLALAISAIVIILSINYYSEVKRGQKINQTIQQFRSINSAMIAVVAKSSTSATPSSQTDVHAAVAAMLPTSALVNVWDPPSTITFTNPATLTVKVTSPFPARTGSCLGYTITLTGLPTTAKNQLQNALTNKFMTNFPRLAAFNPTLSDGGAKMVFGLCLE